MLCGHGEIGNVWVSIFDEICSSSEHPFSVVFGRYESREHSMQLLFGISIRLMVDHNPIYSVFAIEICLND